MKLAELYHLSRIRWQLFGTLTFSEHTLRLRESGLAAKKRERIWHQFGREAFQSLRYRRENWKYALWALRCEEGEIGGLWHFHFLMTGLKDCSANFATCKFLENLWTSCRGGGFTKIRVFDQSQNGVEYISKCVDPQNKYEHNKFGLASTITLSPGVVRVLNKPWRMTAAFRSATAENHSTVHTSTSAVPEMGEREESYNFPGLPSDRPGLPAEFFNESPAQILGGVVVA